MTTSGATDVPPGPGPGPAAAPLWPSVIGVLSMVLGGTSFLTAGPGVSGSAQILISVAKGDYSWLTRPQVLILLGLYALRGAADLTLVVAGWLLWRRRRGAGVLHLVAAAAAIPAAALPIVLVVGVPEHAFPQVLCTQIGLELLALSYPAFLLAWFARPSIRGEVKTWRGRPGPAALPAEPVWPAALGVVSMVLAGRHLFRFIWSFGSLFLSPQSFLEGAGLGKALLWLFNALLWTGVGVLLLVAGWRLCRRRRGAAVCHVVYALLAAAAVAYRLVLVGSWLPARGPDWYTYASLADLGLRAIFSLAFPVFLVVWFLRPKIRRQLRSWREPPARLEEAPPDR